MTSVFLEPAPKYCFLLGKIVSPSQALTLRGLAFGVCPMTWRHFAITALEIDLIYGAWVYIVELNV